MDYIILYILLILNLFSFLLGYLCRHLQDLQLNRSFIKYKNNDNKQNQNSIKNTGITIDDKKVVVNIDTKGLEKKYEELGDKIISQTNISNSVNKLKNLKNK